MAEIRRILRRVVETGGLLTVDDLNSVQRKLEKLGDCYAIATENRKESG